MMRRGRERLRESWTVLLRGELDGVRAEMAASVSSSFAELRQEMESARAARGELDTRAAEHESELAGALHHVAEAFEGIAAALDSDRRDRRDQLDAVEFLLREMVLGFTQPTSVPPIVLGGTVDTSSINGVALGSSSDGSVDIDLSDAPLPVETFVEVRSRFHDRWVHGFAVSEYIAGPSRRGYRLRRLTDTEQLPLLFDAADVRRATVPSDHPVAIDQADEPEPSMWR